MDQKHERVFIDEYYSKIANFLKSQKPISDKSLDVTIWCLTVEGFIKVFSNDNPNFNNKKFLNECGVKTL